MENSSSLATDSFSYSWFDGSSEAARIYHNYDKFFKELDLDFDFNFRPEPKSPATLVPADEIFSDGRIKPSSTSTPASPIICNIISYSQDISNTRTCPVQQVLRSRKCDQYQYYYFLRKLSKSSNKIFRNFFAIFRVAKRSRKSIRVDDLDRKVWEVGSLSNSPIKTSPDGNIKLRMDYKDDDDDDVYCKRLRNGKKWNNSPMASPQGSPSHHIPTYDLESSIHEAILHCKRSFGQ